MLLSQRFDLSSASIKTVAVGAPLRRWLLFLILASGVYGSERPAVDAIFRGITDARSPGAAVMVRQKGRTIMSRGFGVTDLRTFRKIDARTNFRLASFSKQFTAMAIMLLVHDGKLRYDENLVEIFPNFPEYGRAITIRHLLTHTSGLADYETLMDRWEKAGHAGWSATKQIQDEEVLALLAQQTHGDFAPGTSWAYSNSGYVVLGLIVAKAGGLPYAEFLQRRIFKPLQMAHTVAYVKGQNRVSRRAYGYSQKDGQFQDTDQSSTSATLGDGGIYSNLLDLARWDDALRTNKLLGKSEMAAALEPVKLNDGSEAKWPANGDGDNLALGRPVAYGFGWFLSPIDGRACMWHTGSTSGFRTVIERFMDDGTTVMVLLNRTDIDPAELAQKLVRWRSLAK